MKKMILADGRFKSIPMTKSTTCANLAVLRAVFAEKSPSDRKSVTSVTDLSYSGHHLLGTFSFTATEEPVQDLHSSKFSLISTKLIQIAVMNNGICKNSEI